MTTTDMPGLRSCWAGRILSHRFDRLPQRNRLLAQVVRREGGQMHSATLRQILSTRFGVHVGAYAYGSLLDPGMCDEGTTIGRYASIGPNVRRFGAAHPMHAVSLHPFFYRPELGATDAPETVERTGCDIGPDVWIGANAVILPGCRRIGVGAVVGAGAVVARDVGPYEVVVGSPARVIRHRLGPDLRAELQASEYWLLEPREVAAFAGRVGADVAS